MKKIMPILLAVILAALTVLAGPGLSGAIFTSDINGSRVNQNHYSYRTDVYLNGGPNNANSSGLPAGEYYFEVTDPSGKTLLSMDTAECRQLVVNADGRVYGVPGAAPCTHEVGYGDASNGALPVQLAPFYLTPNNGGEYKVTLIKKDAPGVTVEDDGYHIDYPKSAAKSDNFKVRELGD